MTLPRVAWAFDVGIHCYLRCFGFPGHHITGSWHYIRTTTAPDNLATLRKMHHRLSYSQAVNWYKVHAT